MTSRDKTGAGCAVYEAVFEASPIAQIVVRIADRNILECNRSCLRLLGVEREEIIDKKFFGTLIRSASERERFWRLVSEEPRFESFEFTYEQGSLGSRDALASGHRIVIDGVDHALLMVQDDTARRQAERALDDANARFAQLAETIDEVFWLTDPSKGQMIYVSPAYDRIWQRPGATLYIRPRDWVEAIHPDDRARVVEAATTKQVEGTYDEEYRIVTPKGAVRWIRDRAYPVRDASGRVFRIAGSAQDITDKKALEAQLHQTQKMESIGILAGGVAHDFNNLITVISSNCQALQELLPPDEETREVLGEIREASERAEGLTRQLLAFSRREIVQPRPVDVNDVIVDTERMLRRILGEDILLSVSSSGGPARVRIDPGSWVQILMNLAVNARDAMPRGGRLSIETTHVVWNAELARSLPSSKQGPYVMLSVSDSGIGMTPEIASRIFEPFFTTKGLGIGTGLGLSVVHGIVAASGGHIAVTTAPKEGTTFRVYLPALSGAPPSPKDLTPAANIAAAKERILVVDDEDGIRRVAIRALDKLGYQLMQAANGASALEIAENAPHPIDLLITDVVMPGMDGSELAEALRKRFPNMRVLYTSGYTDDAIVRHGISESEVAFLPKPYDLTSLRLKVREMLEPAASPAP